jgi:predicted RNase H-like HicB family nuclease
MAVYHELQLKVVVYEEAGGFVAQCLNVDVASDGDTEQGALDNLRETLTLYFDDENNLDIPTVEHAKVTKLTLLGA